MLNSVTIIQGLCSRTCADGTQDKAVSESQTALADPCNCTQTVFLSAEHKLSAGGHSEMSQAEIMLLDFEDCLLLKIFIKVRKYIGNLLLLWLLGNMQAYTSSAHTEFLLYVNIFSLLWLGHFVFIFSENHCLVPLENF